MRRVASSAPSSFATSEVKLSWSIRTHYRAAEWGHKEIELAAHDLLQLLDATRA